MWIYKCDNICKSRLGEGSFEIGKDCDIHICIRLDYRSEGRASGTLLINVFRVGS
jgi:hypothetical protein